ncbi:glutamate racemase [Pseudorhodoplanes sinuspersici]|uniref:Glutamate racemase n=1 Tax=Pseudorhodoplanes sinuspersici TaxID=1235591 RepID=A0A1W6ZY74_9HYPH|nr:glutamate racemase [Pseudorhodoplanes sinuspersici]ARQ02238.1 glutamate racemase [Pseudorhodoplanes sinuspersici]RKE74059.1 glutamate racemase [Pseudorhodoplanes sinuspersici]
MTAASPTILVFDSGLGGLTVHREIVKLRPDARFVYAADDEAFPYGRLSEVELLTRVIAVMAGLIETHRPDLIVIACNTASTIVLAELRTRFTVPFVGTVPAIKPACAASQTRMVSVLGTEATVAREYTKALIRDFGQGCDVTLIGSKRLAVLAEALLNGEDIDDEDIAEEIMPCFLEKDGARTDTIVLACTHYPLLLERFNRVAPWPVTWLDPAPAIAKRVVALIGHGESVAGAVPSIFLLTSKRPAAPLLQAALRGFGFSF